MKKSRLRLLLMVLAGFILCAILIAVYGMKFKKVEDGVWVGSSRIIPYEYTMYRDHAVLNKYCGQEQEVVIPEKLWGRPVTVIGESCFSLNEKVKKIIIPKTVVEIEFYAFERCDQLMEVTGGEQIKVVQDHAFIECPKLEKVELGNQIEEIGSGAFRGCKSLKEFKEQDNLMYIGWSAFDDSGLEVFKFNKNVEVDDVPFYNTPWLDSQQEQFLIYGEGLLMSYQGEDGTITIPDEVKKILRGCFDGMSNSEIILPQTVEKIDNYAFSNCTNIEVYIPSTVKVGDKIFAESCDRITIITTQDSYAREYAEEHGIPYEITEDW